MSQIKIFTIEELTEQLKNTVSDKRFVHSLGVADMTKQVLEHYNAPYEKNWKGFDGALFCGIAHDFARELTSAQILDYCKKNNIYLPKEAIKAPVIAHGVVSAQMVENLVGLFPASWNKAICLHTTGNRGMDNLSLALFVADFIEPSRTFMTDKRRAFYLSSPTLCSCAYKVLCDMMNHWEKCGLHDASGSSKAMKEYLEKEVGCRYED